MRRIVIALVLRGLRAPYVCVHEEQFEELRSQQTRAENAETALHRCHQAKRALREEFESTTERTAS